MARCSCDLALRPEQAPAETATAMILERFYVALSKPGIAWMKHLEAEESDDG
jgi:hypothetical protein